MNGKVKVTSANKLFLLFVVMFFSFSILVSILGLVFPNISDYFIIAMNEIVIILIPVIIFSVYKKLNLKTVFKLNKLKAIPALLIVVISFPAYFMAGMLNNIVVYLINFIGEVPVQQIPVPQNIMELIFGIIMIAVLPAICEEALNRGILLNAYEARGTYKAVFITAIFFGVFHFDITNFFGPIVLGALLGYYAVRTNSIFAPMLAHFLNNAIAECFSYFYRNEPQPSGIVISSTELGAILIYGLIAAITVFFLLKLFIVATKDTCNIKPSISGVREDLKAVLTHWPVIIVVALYIIMAGMYIVGIATANITTF